jgi:ActD protein
VVKKQQSPLIYGIIAEFDTSTGIVEAARAAYDEGYRKMDAYTPFPIEELTEAIGFRKTRLPLIVLIGGIVGCVGGFALCYWISAVAYPLNIGGRPLASWPSFVPVAFECTILVASLSAVLGMLALNGLPQPYHPVFNTHRFELASRNTFFLCVEADDPHFDVMGTTNFLKGLGAREVSEVEY